MAPRRRATQQSRDTRKAHQAKQPALNLNHMCILVMYCILYNVCTKYCLKQASGSNYFILNFLIMPVALYPLRIAVTQWLMSCLLFAALWSPAGKGLTSRLSCV